MSNLFTKLLSKLGIIKDKKKDNNYTKTYEETIKHTDNHTHNFKNTKYNSENYQNQSNQKILEQQPTLNYNQNINSKIEIKESTKIYDITRIDKTKINTIWDIIKAKENTQAEHILNCLPEDQWIDMEELKQRIKLQYNIEYQNEKSLYPYIKTLTDINLIKLNNAGKKRTWKKNIILIEKE